MDMIETLCTTLAKLVGTPFLHTSLEEDNRFCLTQAYLINGLYVVMLQAFAIYLTCGALLYCSSAPGRRTELHEWEKAPVWQQIEGIGHFAVATNIWKSHAISTLE